MTILLRLMELLAASRRLKQSRPMVLQVVASFSLVVAAVLFGIILCAFLVVALLWLAWQGLIATGLSEQSALAIAFMLGLAILGVVALIAHRAWRATREEIDQLLQAQTPAAVNLAGRVTDIAGSFLSGLRNRIR